MKRMFSPSIRISALSRKTSPSSSGRDAMKATIAWVRASLEEGEADRQLTLGLRLWILASERMVPEVGLEPTRLAAMDFESIVYTDFTTRAGAGVYRFGAAAAMAEMHRPSPPAGARARIAVQAA